MEHIAFISGNQCYYWSSVVLSLAALAAMALFLGLYLEKEDNGIPAACFLPLAAGVSLLLARLLHWYCLPDNYGSFSEALARFDHGGYALTGVIAGCLLVALALGKLKIVKDLPNMLDCLAISGAAGICVGRLNAFFNAFDRGMVLSADLPFPWVYPVENAVSGALEYRLATFAIQSILTGLMGLGLYIFWRKEKGKGFYRPGDTALLFGMVYGASEVVMDSTRYDSLYFRSNGFVSIVQVLGAVALVAGLVVFSLRMVKRQGLRKKLHLPIWGAAAVLVGLAGYMEYYVQRHASYAAMCYGVMGLCLCGVIGLAVYIRYLAQVKGENFDE